MVVLEWVEASTVADSVAVVRNPHLPATTARHLPMGRFMVLAWAMPAVLSCVASVFQVTFTMGVLLAWEMVVPWLLATRKESWVGRRGHDARRMLVA